jgi:hypothetical protein
VGGVPGHDSPQVMFAEDQDAVGEFGKDAVEILHRARAGRAGREQELLARVYPAYTTRPAGWDMTTLGIGTGLRHVAFRMSRRPRVGRGWSEVGLRIGYADWALIALRSERIVRALTATGEGSMAGIDCRSMDTPHETRTSAKTMMSVVQLGPATVVC